jgi:hypothetical protein
MAKMRLYEMYGTDRHARKDVKEREVGESTVLMQIEVRICRRRMAGEIPTNHARRPAND